MSYAALLLPTLVACSPEENSSEKPVENDLAAELDRQSLEVVAAAPEKSQISFEETAREAGLWEKMEKCDEVAKSNPPVPGTPYKISCKVSVINASKSSQYFEDLCISLSPPASQLSGAGKCVYPGI